MPLDAQLRTSVGAQHRLNAPLPHMLDNLDRAGKLLFDRHEFQLEFALRARLGNQAHRLGDARDGQLR